MTSHRRWIHWFPIQQACTQVRDREIGAISCRAQQSWSTRYVLYHRELNQTHHERMERGKEKKKRFVNITQFRRWETQLGVLESAGRLALALQHLLHSLKELEIIIIALPLFLSSKCKSKQLNNQLTSLSCHDPPATTGAATSTTAFDFFFFFFSPNPTSYKMKTPK